MSRTFKKKSRFEIGIATELPPAYKKFWREWKVLKPAAVHFVPQESKWKRDELTGETLPVQNVPIPLKFPAEIHDGIWGGEAVVKGTLHKFLPDWPKKECVFSSFMLFPIVICNFWT